MEKYIFDNFPSYAWTEADEHEAQKERDRVAELEAMIREAEKED